MTMGYTLKLDLSTEERNVLVELLRTDLRRSRREGTTDSPWHDAVVSIHSQILGYEVAVAKARRITGGEG